MEPRRDELFRLTIIKELLSCLIVSHTRDLGLLVIFEDELLLGYRRNWVFSCVKYRVLATTNCVSEP